MFPIFDQRKEKLLTLCCGPSSFHDEKNSKNTFILDACKLVETYQHTQFAL